MNVEIWHVKGTRFHFGRHGLGQEKSGAHFPSDSLFAALMARIAATQGREAVEAFSARFANGSPPFVLTSAFPRIGEILFFPPPLISGSKAAAPEGVKPKKLKKVAYVSEGVFRALIAGSSLEKEWQHCEKFQKDTVLLTREEAKKLPHEITRQTGPEPLWKITRQPRVTIDRATNHSAIYHTGQVIFNKNAGLWFGLRWLEADAALKRQVENAFAELGHAGLGGERSSGYGVCEIKRHTEIQLPPPAGKPWVSLSRYIPKETEIFALADEVSAYQIETIGGWVRAAQGKKDERRKAVTLLSEGAVLGALKTDAPGMMVDAQPSYQEKKPLGHPVYRSGFAFGVGLGKGD